MKTGNVKKKSKRNSLMANKGKEAKSTSRCSSVQNSKGSRFESKDKNSGSEIGDIREKRNQFLDSLDDKEGQTKGLFLTCPDSRS